jgi:hypothetical protein
MVSVSASRASECNERRAARQLAIVASAHGMDDPISVSKESSRLILNILFSCVKMNDKDGSKMLGKDSMTAYFRVCSGAMIKTVTQATGLCFKTGLHQAIRRLAM